MPDQDLLATCWTTAGDAAPLRGDERSPLPLRERVEAVAAAGFRGIGLKDVDLRVAEREHGTAGIRSLLDDNGLVHLELELLTDWWADGPRRQRSDVVRRELLEAAGVLGARHVKVAPDVSGEPWDHDRWVTELAALSEDARQAGTRVGLEFLPWSNIRTVRDGLRLVREAGHDAGGIIIDVWHTERAGTPPAELAAVPLRHIVGVELSDADADQVGTLFEDTANRRRLCGEGAFDLQGCIKALRAAGWTGPWGVEILSEEFRWLPVREAAAAAFATAEAQLELAGDGR
ncbi:MAG TPA: sugar phosphate isomerase/epimerase family protein [Actinomycetes bacterium]|nr:sugar phosphate isomerase/epimerase family protein [Actinomycetes bacterium]